MGKTRDLFKKIRGGVSAISGGLRIVATAMIEQQKLKGPELPLVPVKGQRHELLFKKKKRKERKLEIPREYFMQRWAQ